SSYLSCPRRSPLHPLFPYTTLFRSISPNVMGRVLHLHPLTVITVILAAGSIGGFLGILFAVPIYAVIKTTVVHFYQTYQESKTSDRKSTRLNSSHVSISYDVFCLKN